MISAIETAGLCKRFGNNRAVDRLDLSVPAGSITALLGPNGVGKTTSIKLLLNLLQPDAGEAFILGKESRRLSAEDFAAIGYVSENQELPGWMTVRRFFAYCRAMYEHWDDDYLNALVRQFDLPLDRKLGGLSRGMRVKAALLSSLAYRPKLLVLDEPFSGLDPLMRDELSKGMLEITENEQWTIFVSSHDITEIEPLADRVAIMNAGKCELLEEVESLQKRFRRIEAVFSEPRDFAPPWPADWLLPEYRDRTLRFVHNRYDPEATEAMLRSELSGMTHLEAAPMSLREIFVVLAKLFRLSGTGAQ